MIFVELPLALCSFLFNRLMKNIMRAALMIRDAFLAGRGKAQDWIVLSEDDMLAKPGALPLIMTTAPRWNTHAILATLSPVAVREFIEIHTESANSSAAFWTIVVCTYAGRRTITSIGSHTSTLADGKETVRLEPGTYWLGLRYYEWGSDVRLPAVSADGNPVTAGRQISPETNAFYRHLHKRSNIFYLALHYYLYVVLSYPALFPEAFTRRELLPLGNPETEFFWGTLRRGDELRVTLAPQALNSWNLLLSVYSQASFPIHSEHMRTADLKFTAPAGCIYLFRANRKISGEQPFPREWLQLMVSPRTSQFQT
jgi:hypothetical protein